MDRLLGGVVKNSGKVEASGLKSQGGRIILSASKKVENTGTVSANAATASNPAESGPAGQIEISAPEVVNSGTISAAGSVDGTAASKMHSAGLVHIEATNFTQTDSGLIDVSAARQGGKLSIQATGKVELQGKVDASAKNNNSQPEASPAATPAPVPETLSQGGDIEVNAGGDIEINHATLDASGDRGGRIQLRAAAPAEPGKPQPLPDAPGQGRLAMMGNSTLSVRGRQGQGGTAHLLGDHLDLLDTSKIDASGATSGGTVLVGGDWQGSNGVYQATTVTMTEGVSIDASATQQGDGGKVVLWSDLSKDSLTTAHGTVLVQGGLWGGDGGRVETSAAHVDVVNFRVNALAEQGRAGLWLIDPYDYVIDATQASTISTALNSASVTISTATNNTSYGSNGNSASLGSIRFNAGISKTGSAETTLTLQAARDVVFNNVGVNTSDGKLNLVVITDFGSDGGGGIYLNGGTTATSFNTRGGHVWLGGNGWNTTLTTWNGLTVGGGWANSHTNTLVYEGVNLNRASINTAGGDVYMAGRNNRYVPNSERWAVLIQNGSNISTGTGSIEINGGVVTRQDITNSFYPLLFGVDINASTLQTTTGNISITGGEPSSGDSYHRGSVGVRLFNGTVQSTGRQRQHQHHGHHGPGQCQCRTTRWCALLGRRRQCRGQGGHQRR